MQNRGITLFLITTALFLGIILVQNLFFPATPSTDPESVASNPSGEASDQETEAGAKNESSNDDASTAEGDAADPEASGQDNVDQPAEGASSTAAQGESRDDPDTESDEPNSENSFLPDQLLGIGSMSDSADCRMLVTVNRVGGTIRRVELNERLPSGRLKYRDVDNKPGYLGNLELTPAAGGCRVNFIGDGTPAFRATCERGDQLEPGDVITSLKVVGAAEALQTTDVQAFQQAIAATKPRQAIELEVQKSGDENQLTTFRIELEEKPLEVVRPESYLESQPDAAESFQMTVLNTDSTVWSEISQAESLRNGIWEIGERSANRVELFQKIPISGQQQGTLKITKAYEVATIDADNPLHSYHVKFDVKLQFTAADDTPGDQRQDAGEPGNENPAADKPSIKLAFQLFGPSGTPVDGWWYQNKINGNAGKLFSGAGARDLVAETQGGGYRFLGGPKIVSEYGKKDRSKVKTQSIYSSDKPNGGQARFLGVDTQYFAAVLLPGTDYTEDRGWKYFDSYSAFVWLPNGWNIPEEKTERKAMDVSFTMFSKPLELTSGDKPFETDYLIFLGPKDPKVLKNYELEKLRSFGWFWFVSQPLCYLLRFFYWGFSLIGLPSYALAIILLTVIVRGAMVPISRKAALNAQMMQKLAPEMKAIAEKHKDDMEGRLKAQRELFSRNKYNPYSGCGLMFLQLPIFIGLYRGLSVDIALRDQPLIHGLSWCSNLAGPDQLLDWSSWLWGWFSAETGWLGPYFNLLPCITVVLFLIQQKLFTPPPTDEQQEMMQKMMKYMMIFMGVLFFKVPAGLCIYFITSSLWGIIERKLLPKPVLKDEFGKPVLSGAAGVVEGSVLGEAADRRKKEKDRRLKEKRERERERTKKNRKR